MRALSFDIGTAYSKVAYTCEHMDSPQLLPLGANGAHRIPSLAYLATDLADVVFGDAAAEMLFGDPSGVVGLPVRRPSGGPIRANGRAVPAAELFRLFFGHLASLAREHFELATDTVFDRLVIALPSHYGPDDQDVFREAASGAGFSSCELVDQLVAVAQHWVLLHGYSEPSPVLVLDVGQTVVWGLVAAHEDLEGALPLSHAGAGDALAGHVVERAFYGLLAPALEGERIRSAPVDLPLLLRLTRLKERLGRLDPSARTTVAVGNRQWPLAVSDLHAAVDGAFVVPALRRLSDWLDDRVVKPGAAGTPILLSGSASLLPGLREHLRNPRWHVLNSAACALTPAVGALTGVGQRRRGAAAPAGQTSSDGCHHARAHELAREAFLAGEHKHAMSLATPLASSGYAPAQSLLGVLNIHGTGLVQDLIAGAYWLHLAADQGYATAQRELARLLLQGEGLARDVPRAKLLYQLAADQGDAVSCYALAKLHQIEATPGAPTPLFMDYMQRAADLGHSAAAAELRKAAQST